MSIFEGSTFSEIIIGLLLITGGFIALLAGIGVVRFRDTFLRMHASTMAGALGVGLVLIALAIFFGDLSTASKAVSVILFLLLTLPVGSHLLGRAAYHVSVPRVKGYVCDQMKGTQAAEPIPLEYETYSIHPDVERPG